MFKKIIKKIKNRYSLERRVKMLEEMNQMLSIKYKEIIDKATPELVVEKVMGRGIKWYDNLAKDKDFQSQIAYYEDAQLALKNKTIGNEMNHLMADTVEYIAKETKNFEEVDRSRRTIVAIDLLRTRLENISDPRKIEPSTENIHDAV